MKKIILLGLTFSILLFSCINGKKSNELFDPIKAKIKLITFVPHEVLDAVVNSTKKSLEENYNIPSINIKVFNPNGNLDEIRAFVRTLNSQNTDLIISVSTPATQAVLSARHPSIPLLFSFVSDTAALNISTYENVTGISNVLDYKEGFELLKRIFPSINKICVVYNPSEPNSNYSYNQISETARNQTPPINIVSRQFTKTDEIAVAASTVNDVDAFYVGGDNKLVNSIQQLLDVANNKGIPVFASDEGSVKAGAIAAYSIDYNDFGTETAKLAIEILKKKSCEGINILMYKDGKCVVNESSFIKLKLDTSLISSCKKMD